MRTLTVTLIASLTLALSACGSHEAQFTDQAAAAKSGGELAGQYVADGLPSPFGESDSLSITIDGNHIAFGATCNTMSGSLEQSGSQLHVSDIGTTLKGCTEAGQAQDQWLNDFFAAGPSYVIDGNNITLQSGGEEIVITSPDNADVGSINPDGVLWDLTNIEQTDGDSIGATSVGGDGGAPTLVLNGDQLTFSTGCNQANTVLAQDTPSGIWALASVAVTKMGCKDPSLSELEQTILSVLGQGEVTVSFSGNQLRISRADNPGVTLVYTAHLEK